MWPILEFPGYFNEPSDLDFDDKGNIYVADSNFHRIQKFTSAGKFISRWGRQGSDPGEFDEPCGIVIGADESVFVVDRGNHRIQKFSIDGEFISQWGERGADDGQFKFDESESDQYSCGGIAIDTKRLIYIVDFGNHRIQKFTADGNFIGSWGTRGSGNAEFESPCGIAIDGNDRVFVADRNNHRIQVFTTSGEFIFAFGAEGAANGQLIYPHDVELDSKGHIYVADSGNARIQKFAYDAAFINNWGYYGSSDGNFFLLRGIAVDNAGYIYAADADNQRIQKFNSAGEFVMKLASSGTGEGQFNKPTQIDMDPAGNIYVIERNNARVQKFAPDGTFDITWGSPGYGDGEFSNPEGITVDSNGYVYVADTNNHRIQKFGSDGTFISQWGNMGSELSQFAYPRAITTDGSGRIYVVDSLNYRIQKFTSEGVFINAWGGHGGADDRFYGIGGIVVDPSGNVHVAETTRNRIKVFSQDGEFKYAWGGSGSVPGQLDNPSGLAVDAMGYIYVADTDNARIQKFTSQGKFEALWGGPGSDIGQFVSPMSLAVSSNGEHVVVSDTGNNRIQVFSLGQGQVQTDKAIIVAGGGPYEGNLLWDATRMCANYAYRALVYQGYDKETIVYLSHDTNVDLDGNGKYDDIDRNATNADFHWAVCEWAKGASNLYIYIVNHGGKGTFRMNATEILQSSDLGGWLDQVQEFISGKIIVVYDACRSGSFLADLTGNNRVILTSTTAQDEALFASGGTLSFSYFFWSFFFNGGSYYQAYLNANQNVDKIFKQKTQLDANGDGIANNKEDKQIASEISFGKEIQSGADLPFIEKVSPAQTLTHETSASIFAENITDVDGINRVWAVITPPGYTEGDADTPITQLPILDLEPVDANRFQADFYGFTASGVYTVVVYATDKLGTISLPRETTVTKTGTIGVFITDNLWIRSIIHTQEKGPIDAIWQKGGESITSRQDRCIWGHFYADPNDVTWGSGNNPDLFVKIWFDVGGRIDVNYFHVSVPDIEVYSDFPYDGTVDLQGTTTISRRYIRQYYENGNRFSEDNYEDGNPPTGYSQNGNPAGNIVMTFIKIGGIIKSVEKGFIETVWRLGGQGSTSRGDQVVWGLFYANPDDVSWGSRDNPDVFIKIWKDVSGRLDVNFFHVSVPDIEVYSDFPDSGDYDQKGTTIVQNRYIRHEY